MTVVEMVTKLIVNKASEQDCRFKIVDEIQIYRVYDDDTEWYCHRVRVNHDGMIVHHELFTEDLYDPTVLSDLIKYVGLVVKYITMD